MNDLLQLPQTCDRTADSGASGSHWIRPIVLICSMILLSSCGGSDDNSSPESDLQGTWVTERCTAIEDDRSERGELVFSGYSLTQSRILFTGNDTCEGELTIRTSLLGSIAVSGEAMELSDGTAKHIDLSYSKGVITASDTFLAILTAGGTTLQDSFTARGIEDINNIPVTDLRDTDKAFSIYRIEGSRLRIGFNDGINDGSVAELRTDRLGADEFIKQQ